MQKNNSKCLKVFLIFLWISLYSSNFLLPADIETIWLQGYRKSLKGGTIEGVLLLSPRTARTFARLAEVQGLVTEARGLVCYCLSKAIADAVAPLELAVRVPTYAREEDLLALLDSGAPSS